MSQGHGIKGGTTDEVFQEPVFSAGERSFCWCGLFNFQDLLHAQTNRSPLMPCRPGLYMSTVCCPVC